jgi:hypothetical protein
MRCGASIIRRWRRKWRLSVLLLRYGSMPSFPRLLPSGYVTLERAERYTLGILVSSEPRIRRSSRRLVKRTLWSSPKTATLFKSWSAVDRHPKLSGSPAATVATPPSETSWFGVGLESKSCWPRERLWSRSTRFGIWRNKPWRDEAPRTSQAPRAGPTLTASSSHPPPSPSPQVPPPESRRTAWGPRASGSAPFPSSRSSGTAERACGSPRRRSDTGRR